MVMKICKKNFFVIRVSLPWEGHETFDEVLHYKSFSLTSFSTTNQIRLCTSDPQTLLRWEILYGNRIMKCDVFIVQGNTRPITLYWLLKKRF